MQPHPAASLDPPADRRPSLVVVRTAADRKAYVTRVRRVYRILSHSGAFLLGVVLTVIAYRLWMPGAECLP